VVILILDINKHCPNWLKGMLDSELEILFDGNTKRTILTVFKTN